MPDSRIPDWVNETPESGYTLEMWNEDGGAIRSIDLTRAEYIALKRHLAVMRGYAVAAEETRE